MKSSFDKKELNKLNSILFQKKTNSTNLTPPIESPKTFSDNKENQDTCNSNLH